MWSKLIEVPTVDRYNIGCIGDGSERLSAFKVDRVFTRFIQVKHCNQMIFMTRGTWSSIALHSVSKISFIWTAVLFDLSSLILIKIQVL